MKLKDIAKLANVSISAVSLAMNGKPGISEKTRDRILTIAKEHDYPSKTFIKNQSSPSQGSKILRFIACVNEGIVSEKYETLPFFMELIHQIEVNIQSKGYSLMISSIDINSLFEDKKTLDDIRDSEGIILLGTNLTKDQIKYISENQKNLVVIDTCFDTLNIDFIVMNNIRGAYDAGRYLIENGHKKIGYVKSNTRFYNFNMREKGFHLALSESNIALENKFIYSMSPTDVSPQEAFKNKILHSGKDLPSALFCECDYMAISVVKSLSDLGIDVPNEISVIGFDNIWESQIIHPELTTIDVKKDRIASFAVEKLIENIENKNNERIKLFVDTDIVVRNSTKSIQKADQNALKSGKNPITES